MNILLDLCNSFTLETSTNNRSKNSNIFCSILVNRIVEFTLVQEAHQRLISLIELIEEKYDRNKITLNLNLSLHLSDCSYDYGPQYAFWCFSFERMNGILGKS